MPGYFTAVDPGESTGWVRIGVEDLMPLDYGIADYESGEVWEWIEQQSPVLWLPEQFRVRPPKKGSWVPPNQWGTVPTIRVLGAIESHAHRNNIPIHYQEPSIMRVSAGWNETQTPKKGEHWKAALLHAKYYLEKNKGHYAWE